MNPTTHKDWARLLRRPAWWERWRGRGQGQGRSGQPPTRQTGAARSGGSARLARSARRTLVVAGLVLLASHLLLLLALEGFAPQLRDPEYGRKLAGLRQRLAEAVGDKPLVLVLGSSRVSMGLRPGVLPADTPALVYNGSIIGSGPLLELLAVRRYWDDGIRPRVLVLEVWAPFLKSDGPYLEEARIDVNRLAWADVAQLLPYSRDPQKLRHAWRQARLNPWYSHRYLILNRLSPAMLPWFQRRDFAWEPVDGWGWLPSNNVSPDPEARRQRLELTRQHYQYIFTDYTITPLADRALRDCIATVQRLGVAVALLQMPESSEFRQFYPPDMQTRVNEYFHSLQTDFAVPLIDARTWNEDADLLDGFHLTRDGAIRFTQQFAQKALPTLLREVRP
jgi:hypothetical protein